MFGEWIDYFKTDPVLRIELDEAQRPAEGFLSVFMLGKCEI